MYWPSVGGKKTFLGKEISSENNPAVKFIDPDTGEVLEDALPDTLSQIDETTYGDHTEFIKKCYPEGNLREDLSKRDKYLVKTIIWQIAYSQFMEQQEDTGEGQVEWTR